MPKFNKPDSPNIIWGSGAPEGNLTRPSNDYIQTGWTQVKPPYEYENYSMNKLYQGFAYYNQFGFPEWDSATEYQLGTSYVQGSNNKVYKCIQTHINRNPTTSGNEDYWEVFEGNRQASTTSRGTTTYATDAVALATTSSSTSLVPSNLKSLFGSFVASKSEGSLDIPVNMIGQIIHVCVKWGTTPPFVTNNEVRSIVFSTPFENDCLYFDISAAGVVGSAGNSEGMAVNSYGKESATVSSLWNGGTTGTVRWIAIGY